MLCKEFRSRLSACLDGELPETATQEIEEHLRVCAGCNAALDQLRKADSLLDADVPPPVPHGFADRVMSAANAGEPKPTPATVPLWPSLLRIAAAVLIGLGFGGWMASDLWRDSEAPTATTQADVTEAYNIDALADAPNGSLAASYLSLASGIDMTKGR